MFSCLTREGSSSVPTLSVVLAADERRARELALRQVGSDQPVHIEIREGGRLVLSETTEPVGRAPGGDVGAA
jgi:hypothetical protein